VLKQSSAKQYKNVTLQSVLKTRENKLPSKASLKKSRVIVRNIGFQCTEVAYITMFLNAYRDNLII
jgi:hypothetical protein